MARHTSAVTLKHVFTEKRSSEYSHGCSRCSRFYFTSAEHARMHMEMSSCHPAVAKKLATQPTVSASPSGKAGVGTLSLSLPACTSSENIAIASGDSSSGHSRFKRTRDGNPIVTNAPSATGKPIGGDHSARSRTSDSGSRKSSPRDGTIPAGRVGSAALQQAHDSAITKSSPKDVPTLSTGKKSPRLSGSMSTSGGVSTEAVDAPVISSGRVSSSGSAPPGSSVPSTGRQSGSERSGWTSRGVDMVRRESGGLISTSSSHRRGDSLSRDHSGNEGGSVGGVSRSSGGKGGIKDEKSDSVSTASLSSSTAAPSSSIKERERKYPKRIRLNDLIEARKLATKRARILVPDGECIAGFESN